MDVYGAHVPINPAPGKSCGAKSRKIARFPRKEPVPAERPVSILPFMLPCKATPGTSKSSILGRQALARFDVGQQALDFALFFHGGKLVVQRVGVQLGGHLADRLITHALRPHTVKGCWTRAVAHSKLGFAGFSDCAR